MRIYTILMKYRPFWCNIDHKFKNIDDLSKMVDYRPMVDNIDPVAALPMDLAKVQFSGGPQIKKLWTIPLTKHVLSFVCDTIFFWHIYVVRILLLRKKILQKSRPPSISMSVVRVCVFRRGCQTYWLHLWKDGKWKILNVTTELNLQYTWLWTRTNTWNKNQN